MSGSSVRFGGRTQLHGGSCATSEGTTFAILFAMSAETRVLPRYLRYARSLALLSGATVGFMAGATIVGGAGCSLCMGTPCPENQPVDASQAQDASHAHDAGHAHDANADESADTSSDAARDSVSRRFPDGAIP
jgi:hypothetical protein